MKYFLLALLLIVLGCNDRKKTDYKWQTFSHADFEVSLPGKPDSTFSEADHSTLFGAEDIQTKDGYLILVQNIPANHQFYNKSQTEITDILIGSQKKTQDISYVDSRESTLSDIPCKEYDFYQNVGENKLQGRRRMLYHEHTLYILTLIRRSMTDHGESYFFNSFKLKEK